jgi:hypothetical protein
VLLINGREYALTDIQRFWANGDLSYLLYDYQLPLYEALWNILNGEPWYGVINCARQFGKTFVTTLVFMEIALRKQKQDLHFLAENRAFLKDRVYKAAEIIMETCPYHEGSNLRPFTKGSGKEQGTDAMIFPTTKSTIRFFGVVEDGYRGGSPNAVNLDEAAFIKGLKKLVVSEIEPSFVQTKGKLVATSTPATTNDNYYNDMVAMARDSGTLVVFTAEDNANFSKEELAKKRKAATEPDGSLSADFRREYMAELIPDASMLILPAWDDRYIISHTEHENDKANPEYQICHKFISVDYGTLHFSVVGYYYYRHWTNPGKLVKEHSMWIRGEKVSVGLIARDIKENKEKLWQMGPGIYPVLVVCDSADALANQTLQQDYSIPAIGVKKERHKSTMVDKLNTLISLGEFGVVDGLAMDIGCYRSGVWLEDFRGTKFAESERYGHYDGIDGDVYLNLMARGFYNQRPVAPLQFDLRTQHGPEELVKETLNNKIGGRRQNNSFPTIESLINPVW